MRVKSEARRQAILTIAKEAFIEQGFEHTSMSAIAKKLGGSKATLYNYFSSKEEILCAVMNSSITDRLIAAFQGLSGEDELRPALSDFGFVYLKSILSPELSAIHKMALCESDRSEIGQIFYENGPKLGWQHVSGFFQQQITNGQMRECDIDFAAKQLKALLEAELLAPYELGIISQPDDELIRQTVMRATDSFMILYASK